MSKGHLQMEEAWSAAPGTHLETSPCQTGQGSICICVLLFTPSLLPSRPRWLTQAGGSAHLTEHLPKGEEENNRKSPDLQPVPQALQQAFLQTNHRRSAMQEVSTSASRHSWRADGSPESASSFYSRYSGVLKVCTANRAGLAHGIPLSSAGMSWWATSAECSQPRTPSQKRQSNPKLFPSLIFLWQ